MGRRRLLRHGLQLSGSTRRTGRTRGHRLLSHGHRRHAVSAHRAHGTGLNDHDRSVGVRVDPRGVDAGDDEEDKVDGPDEPDEDGGGNHDLRAASGHLALVVAPAVVGAVARIARVVVAPGIGAVPGELPGQGSLETTDDGGGKPDDEADADVCTGMNTRVEVVTGSYDELRGTPKDTGTSLKHR